MPGWSGLYDGWYASPYTGVRSNRQFQYDLTLNKLFRHIGSLSLKGLFAASLGAAAGGAASASYSRLTAPIPNGTPGTHGGLRTLETQTLLSRNTNAADITNLKALFSTTGQISRVRGQFGGRDIPHAPNAFV